jgi:hypothetical protein
MEDVIVNKVAESGLIILNHEEYHLQLILKIIEVSFFRTAIFLHHPLQ